MALPVIGLAGPTGCGKTAIAVEFAKRFGCEIINADSRQLYKDFPVITAQPEEREKEGIRHHLYGIMDINSKPNAGKWMRLAQKTVLQVLLAKRIPLLVGGTGFYFKAICEGLAEIPEIPQEITAKFLKMLACGSVEDMYDKLCSIDKSYAAKIHKHDRQRILRALEVFEYTGKNFTWWHENSMNAPACYGIVCFMDMELKKLEPNLYMRIEKMIANGAVEEAKTAFEKCKKEYAPGWSGIGCNELYKYLQGETSFNECCEQWRKNTRAYAKRQLTWFRGRKNLERIENIDDMIKKTEKFTGILKDKYNVCLNTLT